MLKPLLLAMAVMSMASCTSSASSPTGPTTTTSSTTTTIVGDTCDRVTADTAVFLEDLLDRLDETHLADIRDRGGWPDDLSVLERSGADLDIRIAALRCDPVRIRQQALDQVNLAPGGPLSQGLLDILLAPPTSITSTTSTTTTSPSTSTSDVDPATTSGG